MLSKSEAWSIISAVEYTVAGSDVTAYEVSTQRGGREVDVVEKFGGTPEQVSG